MSVLVDSTKTGGGVSDLTLRGIATINAPPVPTSDFGTIYYDLTLSKWQVAEGGAAFVDLVGGSVTLNAAYIGGRAITADVGDIQISGGGGIELSGTGGRVIVDLALGGATLPANTPGFTFLGRLTTGLSANNNNLRLFNNGSAAIDIGVSSIAIDRATGFAGNVNCNTGKFRGRQTSAATPTFAFDDALETSGLFQPTDNKAGIAAAGNEALLTEWDGSAIRIGLYGVTAVVRGAALTAENATIIDATYGADEEGVLNNVRTRLGELESRMQGLGAIN